MNAIFSSQSEDEWKIVFYIAAGIYLIGSTLYFFMSSGEVQSWAKISNDDESEMKWGNRLQRISSIIDLPKTAF